MSSEKPIIFISCGQFTKTEKALGQRIRELIDSSGVFQGYFAENQSSLQGVTKNIFARLNQCFGLVCIMHDRGTVSALNGNPTVRASVWIEQEIAIAAFLSEILDRDIKVRVYIEKGIHREGVRDKLLINPTEFKTGDEVLTDVAHLIEEWSDAGMVHTETEEKARLEKLLDELEDNRDILSLDLSNFQSLEEERFRDLKKSGELDELAPGLKQSIKQTYRVMANYSTCLQRTQNIQNYGARANEITMFLSPAKQDALKSVSELIHDLKQLLGKAL
jgi:hypothetical protein